MDTNDDRSLIPVPNRSLARPTAGADRILSAMVGETLALVSASTVERVDLDAVVREAKRIQRREGMTPEDIHAFSLFCQAATSGHSEAQYLLFDAYLHGFGHQPDNITALRWLRKAVESGFVEAPFILFHCCLRCVGHVPLLRKCFEEQLTNALAEAFLGDQFSFDVIGNRPSAWFSGVNEIMIPANQVVTYELLQKLASAYNTVFDIFPCPILGKVNEILDALQSEATKSLLKAAEGGHCVAQYRLGDCYLIGRGVPKDWDEAVRCYRKAAELGHARAQHRLGSFYEDGLYFPRDYAEAVKWYRKAAELGYADSQWALSRCYQWGHGVECDQPLAYAWCRLAADRIVESGEEAAVALESNDLRAASRTDVIGSDFADYNLGGRATEMAAEMDPAEVEIGQRLYREFKAEYLGKR